MAKKICVFDYVICVTIVLALFVPFFTLYKYINLNSQNIPFSLQSKIMSGFRLSHYKNQIQNTYVSARDKSELKILIKPSFWKIMSENDKKEILNIADKKWSKIFAIENKNTKATPQVVFANK